MLLIISLVQTRKKTKNQYPHAFYSMCSGFIKDALKGSLRQMWYIYSNWSAFL